MSKQEKQKVDLGKGFKRIYFVLAFLWIAFVAVVFAADFSACIIYAQNPSTLRCDGYNLSSSIVSHGLWAAVVYPLYLFLKWIVAGFKK